MPLPGLLPLLPSGTLRDTHFVQIQPAAPHYLFVEQDATNRELYERGKAITEIFALGGTGIITKRDKLAVQFREDELWSIVQRFAALAPEEARSRFELPADVRDWKVADAQADISLDGPDRGRTRRILYRPFDQRFTYYTGRARGFLGWPVERISRHFGGYCTDKRQYVDYKHIGLVTTRITKDENTVFVTSDPIAHKATSVYDISYVFPLRLAEEGGENLSPNFRQFIDSRYEHHYTPEEILGYIYGVLHAPTYRTRYAEFLRIDFPCVLFPESADDFETLSGLGWALIQAHLLRELPRHGLAAYHGRGDHTVEAVRYAPAEQVIAINKTQSFRPVPQKVWDFHIGGYQVLDKYLKSRRRRVLSLDEIEHVGAIADSLAFTIEQMAKIDEAYRAAFSDQG